jgi:hypothetical protein
MPKRSTHKPNPPLAPTPAVTTRGAPPPVTPMKPVSEKIGEGPDNLKAREQAYKRRSGLR